jgi:hypothetical protein
LCFSLARAASGYLPVAYATSCAVPSKLGLRKL